MQQSDFPQPRPSSPIVYGVVKTSNYAARFTAPPHRPCPWLLPADSQQQRFYLQAPLPLPSGSWRFRIHCPSEAALPALEQNFEVAGEPPRESQDLDAQQSKQPLQNIKIGYLDEGRLLQTTSLAGSKPFVAESEWISEYRERRYRLLRISPDNNAYPFDLDLTSG